MTGKLIKHDLKACASAVGAELMPRAWTRATMPGMVHSRIEMIAHAIRPPIGTGSTAGPDAPGAVS